MNPQLKPSTFTKNKSNFNKEVNALAKASGKTNIEVLDMQIRQLQQAKSAAEKEATMVDHKNIEPIDVDDEEEAKPLRMMKSLEGIIPKKANVTFAKSAVKNKKQKRKRRILDLSDDEDMTEEEKAFQQAAEQLAEDPDLDKFVKI